WKKAGEISELEADNVVAAAERMARVHAAAIARMTGDEGGAGLVLLRRRLEEAQRAYHELESAALPAQRFRTEDLGRGESIAVPVGSPAEDRAAALKVVDDVVRQAGRDIAAAEKAAQDAAEKMTAA